MSWLEFAPATDLADQLSSTFRDGRRLFVECRDGRDRHVLEFFCPVRAPVVAIASGSTDPVGGTGKTRRQGDLDCRFTCRSVANIVKAYAKRAGFDASTFSGYSLRAGFLTFAAGKGASIFKMMGVSRHKSVDTPKGYVRDAELFKDHAGAGLL